MEWWTDLDGVDQDRCPRRFIKEDTNWWNTIVTAYNSYKSGFLPHAGGMHDQNALFPSIMSLFQVTVDDCEEHDPTKSLPGESLLGKK